MDLHEAVVTLRRFKHRGTTDWWHEVNPKHFGCVVGKYNETKDLTAYEAIAIAKALIEQEKSSDSKSTAAQVYEDIDALRTRVHELEVANGFAHKYAESVEDRVEQLESKSGKPDHFVDLHNKRLHILEAKFRESHPPFRFVPEAEVKMLVREFLKDAVVVIAEAK